MSTATEQRPATAQAALAPQGRFWVRATLAGVLAVALSAAVCAVLVHRLSDQFTVRTDVVGYPLWADFNVERYFSEFHIVAWYFPVMALGLFAAFWIAARRLVGPVAAPAAPPADRERDAALPMLGVAARSALVGLPVGAGVAVTQPGTPHPLWIVAGTVIVTMVLVQVGGRLAALLWPRHPAAVHASMLNAVLAPFGVASLAAAAGVTQLVTLDDGVAHPEPWFPAWLAAAVILVLVALVAVALGRSDTDARRRLIERRSVLFVSVPVLMYLLVASLPGPDAPLGNVLYEIGQPLGGARLMMHGFFPWRDVMLIHGPLQDGLLDMAGMQVFGTTRWGGTAADAMIWTPLFVIGIYLLAAYAADGRTMFFPLATAALLLGGSVPVQTRYLLWPVAVILLLAALRRPTWWRSAALAVVVATQSILVPETGYAVPAVLLALAGFEVLNRRRGASLLVSFPRTLWFCAAGAASAGVFLVVLASHHAVGAFVDYYRFFLPGHEIAGGIPHLPLTLRTTLIAAAPLAGWLVSIAYIGVRLLRRLPLEAQHWTLVACAVMSMLYYGKFLARADGHEDQVLVVALPMLILLGWFTLQRADAAVRRVLVSAGGRAAIPAVASATALLVALLLAPTAITKQLSGISGQYRTVAAEEPWNPRVGFSAADTVTPRVTHDLQLVFAAYLRPGERVFDLSNEPDLLYDTMGLLPPNRFYHATMAMSEVAQRELISELQAQPPGLVIFNSDGRFGLPGWDSISNQVRHHLVAAWILDHYRPIMDVDGQLLMAPDDRATAPPSLLRELSAAPVLTDLYAPSGVCDWGYIPTFLDTAPSSTELAGATPAWSGDTTHTISIAPPPGHTWSDYGWLEIDASPGFGSDSFTLDQGSPDAGHALFFRTLPRSPARYLVHAGACGQWHGFAAGPLTLNFSGAETISAVKLVP